MNALWILAWHQIALEQPILFHTAVLSFKTSTVMWEGTWGFAALLGNKVIKVCL